MTDFPTINSQRLWQSIRTLGQIGAYDAKPLADQGVCRLALSDEDAKARTLVTQWFNDAELRVSVDQIGNTYADRAGTDPSLAPVMAGSHIDSVPTAGRFDGVLGVLGALEVVRTLNDHNMTTRRPITIAFFTDEEGCRFGTDMLGSAVATGRINLDHACALTDANNCTVLQELERIGARGDEPVNQRTPYAFVECHVEQGPILDHEKLDIGVVTGVQAISWQKLTIVGSSAHAGTTPMSYRHDAGLAAARINTKMHEMCLSGHFGPDMRATMGVITPEPGSINVIPGQVIATVDLRNPDDASMRQAEQELEQYFRTTEQGLGVQILSEQTARTPAVAFSNRVQDVIDQQAADLNLSHRRILAGAGHDAQEWSRVCDTAMIFIPGENQGISHNPREHSSQSRCAAGINVLCRTMCVLASEPS